MDKKVLKPIEDLGGKLGFYYKNLITGDELTVNPDMPLMAASVIKIPVMVEFFKQMSDGRVFGNELFVVNADDKMPSCGALNVLHDGVTVTAMDLCTLMIILSDNTATNLLIKRVGIDNVNTTMRELGLKATKLNRLLFDSEASNRGLENYVAAGEMGMLLEKMYNGTLISKSASEKMLDILLDQRLNGKIPLSLPRHVDVAHKTGEDSGITHDVGIVYAKQPYIACFLSNEVNAPAFEIALHTVSRSIYDLNDID